MFHFHIASDKLSLPAIICIIIHVQHFLCIHYKQDIPGNAQAIVYQQEPSALPKEQTYNVCTKHVLSTFCIPCWPQYGERGVSGVGSTSSDEPVVVPVEGMMESGTGRELWLAWILAREGEGEEDAGLCLCVGERESPDFRLWERGLEEEDIG